MYLFQQTKEHIQAETNYTAGKIPVDPVKAQETLLSSETTLGLSDH